MARADVEVTMRRAYWRWVSRWLWTRIRAADAWFRARLTLAELRKLDDHQLADIGLRRDQLEDGAFRVRQRSAPR